MNADKLSLLRDELADFEKAADHLRYSLERTRGLLPGKDWEPDDLERLEALASRFSRLSDLLTQRIMRLIDELELTPTSTLLDRIHRAEKRGWVESAARLVRIRELRNLIAHEYAADKMMDIYAAITDLSPELLDVVPKVLAYAHELERSYPPADGTH